MDEEHSPAVKDSVAYVGAAYKTCHTRGGSFSSIEARVLVVPPIQRYGISPVRATIPHAAYLDRGACACWCMHSCVDGALPLWFMTLEGVA